MKVTIENKCGEEDVVNLKKRDFVDLTNDVEVIATKKPATVTTTTAAATEETKAMSKYDGTAAAEETKVIPKDDGTVIYPIEPLPDNHPKSFFSKLSGSTTNCVLYLCCIESTKKFRDGLNKCKLNCPDPKVHNHCFQRDQTRHISLWLGRLSSKKAKELVDRCKQLQTGGIPISKVQFTEGFNNWKAGNYIGLDTSTTKVLRQLKTDMLSGIITATGKANCDHISLYRKRGRNNGAVNDALVKVREAMKNHEWGALPIHSIRLKILGGEYNECIILMSSSSSSSSSNK